MAIWWSALKSIPWNEVIAAAPALAQGARKLWKTVRRTEQGPAETLPVELGDDLPQEVARLKGRLAQVEKQQVETAAIVNSLAEQNQNLVAEVESLRLRGRILAGAVAALVIAVLVLAFR